MDEETLAKVTEGVARGEYSLLLGAGASAGAIGGNGKPLPMSTELRDALLEEFSIDTEGESITLSRAYSAAERKDAQRLAAFVTGWFTNCTPSWQGILTEFEWNRIWTLNIDDVIETVYRARSMPIDRFDWTSKYRDLSRAENQVIHLHGYAEDLKGNEEKSQLVFSTNEYAATLKDPRTWHAVFTDVFAEQPFMILGSSLREEFDLTGALTNRSLSNAMLGRPSRISDLDHGELESYGLVPVEDDASHFMEVLQHAVMKFDKDIANLHGGAFTSKMYKFQQQFRDLRTFQPLLYADTSKFYSGYEPQWQNILNDDDARMDSTEKSFAAIRQVAQEDSPTQGIHVLTGDAGAGKSTGLLRIARQLLGDGMSVFLFRGEETLDIQAVVQWLQRTPSTALFVDNCADFADTLMDLADECKAEDIKLLVVGAERLARRNTLTRVIRPDVLHIGREYQYGPLSNPDIISLIDKLQSRRRLGRITREPRRNQQRYFTQEASRRLFDGMANLEGGLGFRERISNNYQSIRSERLKLLYAAASVAYSLGYPLPVGIAAKLAAVNAGQLQDLLGNDQRDLLMLSSNGVHPPHRITASIAVETVLSLEDRTTAIHNLTTALAPHIDVPAIRSESRPYRLLRILMRHDIIMRLMGEEKGREYYTSIQPYFDWNGRYWEQRALFESECGDHAKARSYAEHSISIHAHPFAFNTLGTILGRIAVLHGDSSVLNDAMANLKRAREQRRWSVSEHPYITFFTTMNRFGSRWGLSAIPTRIRSEWNEWFRWATASFPNPPIYNQLLSYQSEWLHLAIPNDP